MAYIATIGAWVWIGLRARQLKTLNEILKEVPESQRPALVRQLLGDVIPASITVSEWITFRRQRYYFFAFLAALFLILCLAGLSAWSARKEFERVKDENTQRAGEIEHLKGQIVSAESQLRALLESEKEHLIVAAHLTGQARAIAHYEPNPQIIELGETLKELLASYEQRVDISKLSIVERAQYKVAEKTAQAAGRIAFARHHVFRLIGNGSRGVTESTALFMMKDEKGYGYFVACYHALHNCEAIAFLDDNNKLILNSDNCTIQVFAVRCWDLVVLRIALPKAFSGRPLGIQHYLARDAKLPREGFIYGYATFNPSSITTTNVILANVRRADLVPGLLSQRWKSEINDSVSLCDTPLEVQLFTGGPTFPGMSGSLIIDEDYRFVGICVGALTFFDLA